MENHIFPKKIFSKVILGEYTAKLLRSKVFEIQVWLHMDST